MTPDMRQGGATDAAPSTISPHQATDTAESSAPPVEVEGTNLDAVLDEVFDSATPQQQPAALLYLNDADSGLFYPRRVNWLSAATGSGKTWAGCVLVASVLEDGGGAAYLDCERDARTIVGRLRALGVSRDKIAAGLVYERPHTGNEFHRAVGRLLRHHDPAEPGGFDVVVLDGVTEALRLTGANGNDSGDVKQWVAHGAGDLARLTPAGVVCIDHLGRAGGDTPAGSFHKHDTVDGVAYVLEAERRLAPGQRGILALRNVKDAQGAIDTLARRGTVAGRIVLDATADDGLIRWGAARDTANAAPSATESAEQTSTRVETPNERREDLLVAVSRVLEAAPTPLSRNKIEKAVGGTAARVREALELLVRENHVARDEVPATGNGKPTHHHRLLQPYGDPAARSSSPPLRGVGGEDDEPCVHPADEPLDERRRTLDEPDERFVEGTRRTPDEPPAVDEPPGGRPMTPPRARTHLARASRVGPPPAFAWERAHGETARVTRWAAQ